MAIYKIPITKAGETIDVNSDDVKDGGDLTPEMYAYCLQLGIKQVLNRTMSKVAKGDKAAAMAQAQENLEKLRAGKTRMTGITRGPRITGAVNTEAMRIARQMVKDEMKAAGLKVKDYTAAQITAAAKSVVAETPEILVQARENVEARLKAAEAGKARITKLLGEAAVHANAKSEKGKVAEGQLSAAKAGRFQHRST